MGFSSSVAWCSQGVPFRLQNLLSLYAGEEEPPEVTEQVLEI